MKERLQKIIPASGLSSRRAAEELIKSGKVVVNGMTATLGDSADIETDVITVDGVELKMPSGHTYIVLNKPKGYITTMSDEKGRKCVKELVSDVGAKVYPVGRLDMYSEGLLIMTDDGELANRLMHPSSEVKKTYLLRVDSPVSERSLSLLRSPLLIDGREIKPAEVTVIDASGPSALLSVSIHEGRNRQIRKMCEASGLRLTRLTRISEGPLELDDLRPGKWRYLTEAEIEALCREAEN